MGRYRKKPVEIDAVQWDGRTNSINEIRAMGFEPELGSAGGLLINTLEGTMRADIGDWIIKGIKGEFYPCKPDVFDATYEEVS